MGSSENISIPKEEYETLVHKSAIYDQIVESEELTKEEIERLEQARLGKSLTEEEFKKKHPELE